MKNKDISKRNIDIAMLLDFYGQLLTSKALHLMELYYDEDMSLAEISEHTNTTRQAVHDSIKRSIVSLEEYEKKLNLIKRFKEQQKIIKLAISDIDSKEYINAKEKLIKFTATLYE